MREKGNLFELLYFGIYEYPLFFLSKSHWPDSPSTHNHIQNSYYICSFISFFFISWGSTLSVSMCVHAQECTPMHPHTRIHTRAPSHAHVHTHVCHVGCSIQWCVIAVTICVHVYMVRGVARGSLPVVPCVFCGSSYLAHLVSLQPIWHLCLEVFCICDSGLFLYIIMKLFIVHDNY